MNSNLLHMLRHALNQPTPTSKTMFRNDLKPVVLAFKVKFQCMWSEVSLDAGGSSLSFPHVCWVNRRFPVALQALSI